MTLPASGTISLSQVSTELGRAANATTSLAETAVRNLASVPSGTINLSNLHGKSAVQPLSAYASSSYGGNSYGSSYCAYDPPFQTCPTPRNVYGSTVTINPSGGSGSYTYSWAYLSGVNATINTPTSASTSFTRSQGYGLKEGYFRCTVSDGNSSVNVDVLVSTEYIVE